MGYKNLSKEQKEEHEREIEEALESVFDRGVPQGLIQTEIEKINEFFENSQWMELEYEKIERNEIRLHGSIDDTSYPECDEIEIVFVLPQAISSVFYDIDLSSHKPFISLIEKEEFKSKVGLPVYSDKCYFFRLANEDETFNYIVAAGIKSYLKKSR